MCVHYPVIGTFCLGAGWEGSAPHTSFSGYIVTLKV
jgi:hypothetical protein